MSKADDLFLKEFGAILAFLVAFAMAMFFLARGIGGASFERSLQAPKAVAARIAPVGQVRLAGDADSLPALGASEPAAGGETGSAAGVTAQPGGQVYNATCAACHDTGAAGAPKVGDTAAWKPRTDQGIDALVHSTVNGKGAMPAKGGNAALSEDDIHAAIVHMLEKTGLAVPAADSEPAAATETAERSASTQPAPDSSEAAQPGDQVYKAACVACHATGAAGAPKVGDAAAWEPRMQQGIDALVHSAVNGKGAMPAKGGNNSLSEADIRSAVEFMLAGTGLSVTVEEAAPSGGSGDTEQTTAGTQVAGSVGAGEQIYSTACAACHASGAAGAPRIDDAAAWEPRAKQGVDALVQSVVQGKGAMPAKGGNNSLSKGDIRDAVEFMLASAGHAPSGSEAGDEAGQSTPEPVSEAPAEAASAGAVIDSSGTAQAGDQVYMTACVVCHASGVDSAPKLTDRAAWASLEDKGVDALVGSVVAGKGTMPARGGSASLSDDELRGAVEFMLETAKFSATATAATQPDTADAAIAEPASSAEEVAATEPAPAASTGAAHVGEQVYNRSCVACHATGTAGAPKVGDDAAWKLRVEQGIDTLVHNAVSGMGAMPAKGGNTALSDEDVRNAVLFMLEQSGVSG